MPSHKVQFHVCGSPYTVSTNDSQEYMLGLAKRLDEDMSLLMAKSGSASVTTAAVMSALSYLDDSLKTSLSMDNMRGQIQSYLEDAARSKSLEVEAHRELDQARREQLVLREKVQMLESLLVEADALIEAGNANGKQTKPFDGGENLPANGGNTPAPQSNQTQTMQKIEDYRWEGGAPMSKELPALGSAAEGGAAPAILQKTEEIKEIREVEEKKEIKETEEIKDILLEQEKPANTPIGESAAGGGAQKNSEEEIPAAFAPLYNNKIPNFYFENETEGVIAEGFYPGQIRLEEN